MNSKTYYVYILASQRHVLYIGITSNIEARVFQHKSHALGGFTAKYNVNQVVYLERYGSPSVAIAREKELKQWRLEKKIALIEATNPKSRNLSDGWYQQFRPNRRVLPLTRSSTATNFHKLSCRPARHAIRPSFQTCHLEPRATQERG